MDTPVGGERYNRYHGRTELGLRMLAHGARLQMASAWSGFTPDQLDTLRDQWLPWLGNGFRGTCPTSFQPFFRSAVKTGEAALFVSPFRMVGLNSTVPSLEGGKRLCDTYEIFREWEPEAELEFDYAVLLAMGSVKGEAVELSNCACGAALLIDKQGKRREQCGWCRKLTIAGRKRRKKKGENSENP